MNKAFIFPGQGSQSVGMGRDFYDAFPLARDTFDAVDEALNLKLSNIIFNGPEEQLTITANTQPALMAVSSAITNVLLQQTASKINQICDITAGHSLGEYSALYAAGSLKLADTAKLLRVRGSAMQASCQQQVGAMAACLGIRIDKIQSLIDSNINSGVCQIANDNIAEQVVISGHVTNINKMIAILNHLGYKAIKLKVSAPFHCQLMKPAEDIVANALQNVTINAPLVPVVANFTAENTMAPKIINSNLIAQVCGRVRWRETLDHFASLGITSIVEIGAGKVLTNMIKRTAHNFQTFNISTVAEFTSYMNHNH